jgi:hypothetical protein
VKAEQRALADEAAIVRALDAQPQRPARFDFRDVPRDARTGFVDRRPARTAQVARDLRIAMDLQQRGRIAGMHRAQQQAARAPRDVVEVRHGAALWGTPYSMPSRNHGGCR